MKDFMDYLTDWRMPGNAIVVYHKGKEVYRYSSGYASVETKEPMSEKKLINIWSCSKVATVVAALQLYERGRFLLDDPLYEYISEFKDMYIKDADGNLKKATKPITIRNLFTHTSGMTYNLATDNIRASIEKNKMAPTLEIVKAIAKEPLACEPGERWGYSLSHDVLAAFVEVVSGKRFADYMKENVFEPIGAKDVYYHRTPELEKRMAEQYRYVLDDNENQDIVNDQIKAKCGVGHLENVGKSSVSLILGEEYDSGGAGVLTSVEDYAKLANALAMGGNAATGERILSAGTVDLMRTNQLSEEQRAPFSWTQLTGYGYGLGVRTLINKAEAGFNGICGEFGWGGAAGATILADPDNEFGYFYAHHMLNPYEEIYQPRLRNVAYACLFR